MANSITLTAVRTSPLHNESKISFIAEPNNHYTMTWTSRFDSKTERFSVARADLELLAAFLEKRRLSGSTVKLVGPAPLKDLQLDYRTEEGAGQGAPAKLVFQLSWVDVKSSSGTMGEVQRFTAEQSAELLGFLKEHGLCPTTQSASFGL